MPSPRNVYDNPGHYWDFLTASDDDSFEGQHFDRKEAGRSTDGTFGKDQMRKVTDEIKESVSAFANANREGSLLVIGVSKFGEIKGINHIPDAQRTSLTRIGDWLINQNAHCKFYECTDAANNPNQICLIYIPYTEHGFCEETGSSAKAWYREGCRNQEIKGAFREQLKREKKLVEFEQAYCCPYDPRDLDTGVLEQFRKARLADAITNYTDEELLYQEGAIVRDGEGYAFTNAGLLFFAANPQRVIRWSYIRLLRFNVPLAMAEDRGPYNFEKEFSGPLSKQIRDIRTFFKGSGFFKTYQLRNKDGGFTEEPEYPFVASDEAIVNAIAHRDHAVQRPIECEAYKDAFLIRNPGRVQQRDHDVPPHFSLDTTKLAHAPRNPKLIEWLKTTRDEHGSAFILAISEGTKRMQDEMAKLSLPAPSYDLTAAQTTVTLFNNAVEREARLRALSQIESTEYANLFPLVVQSRNGEKRKLTRFEQDKDLLQALSNAFSNKGWFIHSQRYGRLTVHQKGALIAVPESAHGVVRLFPAYNFQFRYYWNQLYLCVDYTLEVRNVLSIQALLAYFQPTDLINKTAIAKWDVWQRVKIISIEQEWTHVRFLDFENEARIASNKVIPHLPTFMLEAVLQHKRIGFDLHRAIKQHSLSLSPNAPRLRSEKTLAVIAEVERDIFPLAVGEWMIALKTQPVPLIRTGENQQGLKVESQPEPQVEFNHQHESADIREGITKFGSYGNEAKSIEIIPLCVHALQNEMAALIERLKVGAYKYKGTERTFSTRLGYSSIIATASTDQLLGQCQRLIRENPRWSGSQALDRLFLVHVPEQGYRSDDEQSPYYLIKRFLFEQGLPCQMVDTPTLRNADWKDLNLALNIIAKCGVTPWVLPGGIPDADFFVGLSYTQNGSGPAERLMGYANVFNSFGRWEFYAGNTQSFAYRDKAVEFESLIRQTLERLRLSNTPNIYFHYSAKFSREDKEAILRAARAVRPNGTYTFVWINSHHNVRLYDNRPETDGSLGRGNYVTTSRHQMYLSTTGSNPYRKSLGTPHMLEINARVEQPIGRPNVEPDMRALATQILSLTKLNWASTDSLCAEPITTKYAGNIAYLTAAFLRQSPEFHLHQALEKTPWFI